MIAVEKAKVSVILLEVGGVKTDYYTVKHVMGGCYTKDDFVVHPLVAMYCAGLIQTVKHEIAAIRTASPHAIEFNWFVEDKTLRIAVSLQGSQSAAKQIVKCIQAAVMSKQTIHQATTLFQRLRAGHFPDIKIDEFKDFIQSIPSSANITVFSKFAAMDLGKNVSFKLSKASEPQSHQSQNKATPSSKLYGLKKVNSLI